MTAENSRGSSFWEFSKLSSRAYQNMCRQENMNILWGFFIHVIVLGVLKEFELLGWSQVHINTKRHKLWILCKQKWSGFVALAQTPWTTKLIESTIKNEWELEVFEPLCPQNLWNINHFIACFLSRCDFNVINVRISVKFELNHDKK